jgi:cellulose synthase/poly-beta-1,6-N-acetylglucosamine synthase-like glycosyltransferase
MSVLEGIAATVFWLCLAAMFHTYIFYPLTLRLWPKRFAKPPVMPESDWPTVAVLIPAYNEEKVIEAKVRNSLELDYPPEKLEILIGSDGSTDRTNGLVRNFSDPRVRLFEYEGRNGKPGVLNRMVQETSADILLMTDANVRLEITTFRNLIRHFADPSVAGVAAVKAIVAPDEHAETTSVEHRYATYTAGIKALEGAVGGYSGALGAYYAMRRTLFKPFPLVAMNDDILALTPAILAGMRVAYEPTAIGYEDSGDSVGEEFRRRVRIGASNYKTLDLCRDLIRPSRGMVAYTFFSHKVLHWYLPFFMIFALLANLFLITFPVYKWLLLGQCAGYGLALIGGLLDRAGVKLPIAFKLYYFVVMNVALFLGWIAYRRKSRSAVWQPTHRSAGN